MNFPLEQLPDSPRPDWPISLDGPRVIFSGTIRDIHDKWVTKGLYCIQFYRIDLGEWIEIMAPFRLDKGKFEVELTPSSATSQVEAYGRQIKGMFDLACLPAFRLIRTVEPNEPPNEWTEVLANGGVFSQDLSKLVFRLDFGDLWMFDAPPIKHHMEGEHLEWEYALIGIPRPRGNHTLFPSLWFAISQPEPFQKTTPDTHKVLIVHKQTPIEPAGEPISPQVGVLNNQISLQQSQIEGLLQDLEGANRVLTSQASIETDLKRQLAESGTQIKALTSQVEAAAKPAVAVTDVYQEMISGVAEASSKLAGGAYTLGNVSINLKTLVQQDAEGIKLQLVDALTAEKAIGPAITNLQIDLVRSDPGIADPGLGATPKLFGLTETAARLRLQALGLKLNPVYQINKDVGAGQAFKQSPEPGADIRKGNTVTVIFAKSVSNPL